MIPTQPIPYPKPRGWVARLIARWFRDRSEHALVYEHHPVLGDYIYAPSIDAWHQMRSTANRETFMLRGRGRSPSDDQLRHWFQIEARLPELVAAAVEVVPDPPVTVPWAKDFKSALFLREVRIERDRTMHVFLDLPNVSVPELSGVAICPVVIFSDWAVTAAEWVC